MKRCRAAASTALMLLACGPKTLDVIELGETGGSPSMAATGGAAGSSVQPMPADAGVEQAEPPRYSPPTVIEALASPAEDDDPSFTADLLTLYFASHRNGNEDIFMSTRASVTELWGAPTPVVELNSEFRDATPGVAGDGLTIWFESTRAGGPGEENETWTDIWVSTRASTSESWSEPQYVTELNTDARESGPYPSSPWLMTFSAWWDTGIGDTDIYVTSRASASDPWRSPVLLAGVNSTSWEQGLLRADGTQLFISSGRDLAGNFGNLFWAWRPSPDQMFQSPVPLPELNSNFGEEDLWVSEDLGYVVFVSARSGNKELYEAHR